VGLQPFLRIARAKITPIDGAARIVYRSELVRSTADATLESFFSDRAPLFYRDVASIASRLEEGYFLTAFSETLARLPDSPRFQESHFGEIAACIFAEEVLGLRRIYSKLTLLTAENANAYKMDLLLYKPSTDPLEFVFGEAKISTKSVEDSNPPRHDTSIFASLFDSMREYKESDLHFDLSAASDRLAALPGEDQARIRAALQPYAERRITYAGFIAIDVETYHEAEASVLQTRGSTKKFDVDVLCVERLQEVASAVYTTLDTLRAQCSP